MQVSLALVLASSAGLLVATLRNVASGGRTFEPERLLIAEVDLRGMSYENAPLLPLHDRITDRIREIPGVRAVGESSVLPLLFMGATIGKVLDLPGYENVSDEEIIRTEGESAALAATVQAGIDETVPGTKVRRVRTLTESMSFLLGREQTLAWLATAFGALAVGR